MSRRTPALVEDVKSEPTSRSPTPVPSTEPIFAEIPVVCTYTPFIPNFPNATPFFGYTTTSSENVNQLAKLLLMITNSTASETLPTHVITSTVPTSAFHFEWNTALKEEYESIDKLSSPQYTNLTSTIISPPSSSAEPQNGVITMGKLQVPKVEVSLMNQCALCGYQIVDKEISVIDKKCYHHQCLRCSMCDIPFGYNDKCYVRDGAMLCRNDHAKRYQKCCVKCETPLNREDMVMRAKDLIFHHSCFVCYICGVKLNPGDYYTMSPQGHLYCHAHYNVVRSSVLCDETTTTTVAAAAAAAAAASAIAPPVAVAPEHQPPAREPSTEAEGSTDEDGNGGGHQRSKRMRTSFKHHQLRAMKTYFALNHNPDAKDLKQLAAKTNLTKRVLQVWFQNARAKYRRGLQEGGRGGSPLCVSAPISAMDMNPPLSSSSSGHSTDSFINTPPLSHEIYSPNSNYTHL